MARFRERGEGKRGNGKEPKDNVHFSKQITPSQKRKAKRVAISSVSIAMLLTFFTLFQIATVKITNSDFPFGTIVPTSFQNTQGWETFANNLFGFSFEYPSQDVSIADDAENDHAVVPTGYPEVVADIQNDFYTEKGFDAPNPLFSIRVESTQGDAIKSAPFSLWIFENKDFLSADSWYEKYDYYPFAFAPHIPAPVDPEKPIQNIFLSGLLGKYHLRVSDTGGEVAYIYILRKNTMFLLVINKGSENGDLGDNILSTLRFFPGE